MGRAEKVAVLEFPIKEGSGSALNFVSLVPPRAASLDAKPLLCGHNRKPDQNVVFVQ